MGCSSELQSFYLIVMQNQINRLVKANDKLYTAIIHIMLHFPRPILYSFIKVETVHNNASYIYEKDSILLPPAYKNSSSRVKHSLLNWRKFLGDNCHGGLRAYPSYFKLMSAWRPSNDAKKKSRILSYWSSKTHNHTFFPSPQNTCKVDWHTLMTPCKTCIQEKRKECGIYSTFPERPSRVIPL